MNQRLLHSAKRELQAILASRPTLVALLAAGVVAGLAGPFGTVDILPLLPRLAYWLVVCALTYVTGAVLVSLALARMTSRGWSRWTAAVAAAIPAGLAIAALVSLVNLVVFGPPVPADLAALALNGTAIALVITLAQMLARGADTPAAPDTPAPPPILSRLPLDRRGALVALSVQDHYTEVATTGGRALVLMRLGDAIAETAPTPGIQVHRSHWIATDQVRAARREGARAVLTMSDGQDIPVSRSRVAAVREAGLLPGQAHG
ncbi:LytTR family DNA-binding domain-containing protein [Roseovarius ramblicola]|uniref:LytTR family DNA-binding domain-containing protein n=1 Tax=Roseovarius ramblicola TaxID=2022336 RepID=A0ABV5HY91_9RHOB